MASTDYSKLKNAELENLLKARGLPSSGKKAEMVARLQANDTEIPAPSAAAAAEPISNLEDAPSSTSAAVPPAQESDVAKPVAASAAEEPKSATANGTKPVESTEAPPAGDAVAQAQREEEEKQPEKDFTAGLATTSTNEEIEKRLRRVRKFAQSLDDDATKEEIKRLERMKRFGSEATAGKPDPSKLDAALPERERRKRGRVEDAASIDGQGGRGGKKARGGVRGGVRGGAVEGRARSGTPRERKGAATGSWMSEEDRLKAEKRKARFATTPVKEGSAAPAQ